MALGSDLEVQAAVKVNGDVLLQENAGGGFHLQGDGQRDGFCGAVDLGTQGLLLPSPDLGAHSHCINPAGRKMGGGGQKERKTNAEVKMPLAYSDDTDDTVAGRD